MAGRKHGEAPFWYWLSKKTGKRVSWLFPSVKEANSWRDNTYWKYAKYPNINEYLETVSERAIELETKRWYIHKDNYNDCVLRKGMAIYETILKNDKKKK